VDLTLAQGLFLAVAAFVAGAVDAIAGGGGLITVPALFAVGLPPHLAFGTNKGQSAIGSTAALARYVRAGLIDRKRAPPSFLLGFSGSLVGAALVLAIRPEILRPVVLLLLFAVAVFVAFRRPAALVEPRPTTPVRRALALVATLVIGAYDGFFGPGTGTFLIVAFVGLHGDSMQRASANAKVVNFASNLAAVLLFASRGVVLWRIALPMAAANFLGGLLGAHFAVRVGDGLVRKVLLVVAFALMIKVARDLALTPS
jgi:uncharacterized membrane protein YfcA